MYIHIIYTHNIHYTHPVIRWFSPIAQAIGSTIKLQTATVVGGLAMVDQVPKSPELDMT